MVSTNPGPICAMSNVGSGVPNSFNTMALAFGHALQGNFHNDQVYGSGSDDRRMEKTAGHR